MPIPPIPAPWPPSTPSVKAIGDISKGVKLDTLDLEALVNGGFPGYVLQVAAASPCAFPAVPDGMHRVILHASAVDLGAAGSAMTIDIVRNGVVYPIKGNMPTDISVTLDRGLILRPGDILQSTDLGGFIGGNITFSILYLDVYL